MITDISAAQEIAKQLASKASETTISSATVEEPKVLQNAFDIMAKESNNGAPTAAVAPILTKLPFLQRFSDTEFTAFQVQATQLKQRALSAPISTKGFLLSLGSHFTQKAVARETGRRLSDIKQRHATPRCEAS